MRMVDRSLPYPILSPLRDDVSPNRFDLDCQCQSDGKYYRVTYALSHDSPTLTERIVSKGAAYVLHVESRDCFYRILHSRCTPQGTLDIPADEIVGTVEITGLIVAEQDLPSYSIGNAHEDYGGTAFSVRAGDILACTRTFTFEAEKEFDPLKKIS